MHHNGIEEEIIFMCRFQLYFSFSTSKQSWIKVYIIISSKQILGGSLNECQSTSFWQKKGKAKLIHLLNVIIPIRQGGPNLVPVYEVNKVTNVTPVTRINQRKIEFRTMVTLQYA